MAGSSSLTMRQRILQVSLVLEVAKGHLMFSHRVEPLELMEDRRSRAEQNRLDPISCVRLA